MTDGNYSSLQRKIHTIVFESDTRAGKAFDIVLLVFIIASVGVVILESIPTLREDYYETFHVLEWIFTIAFTFEYFLRMYSVRNRKTYAFSFFGIVDFLSILPTYLTILSIGSQYFAVIRVLRLLRVFRIFRLGHFIQGSHVILQAIKNSMPKIIVFMLFVILMVTVIGAIMYVIESPFNPLFSSIPQAVYWAIVTMTTVGFGDIIPITTIGKSLSALVMLLGYSILAVPTGIISAEMIKPKAHLNTQHCPQCGTDSHQDDAYYCRRCGIKLKD